MKVEKLRNFVKLQSKGDFDIIDVDSNIAAEAAEIKVAQGQDFPLADAIIGATAILHNPTCATDDNHINALDGAKTRWI